MHKGFLHKGHGGNTKPRDQVSIFFKNRTPLKLRDDYAGTLGALSSCPAFGLPPLSLRGTRLARFRGLPRANPPKKVRKNYLTDLQEKYAVTYGVKYISPAA